MAYFSMEFGLHESLPIYSGGLGVLAGDHLKSASDLGIPLVGIGILCDQGYFRQSLDAEGWQQENYLAADDARCCRSSRSRARTAAAPVADREPRRHAQGARLAGRGRPHDALSARRQRPRELRDRTALTSRLYGGDARIRIRQELLLGVGGVKALGAGDPPVGPAHERGPQRVRRPGAGPHRDGARGVAVRRGGARRGAMTVFTTHTPVAAGHDRFPPPLVEEHLGTLREALHLSYDDFMGLGRVHPGDPNEPFCMTVLALKLVAARQRRERPARRGLAAHVAPALSEPDRGRGADRPHHQRRPRADVAAPQMRQLYDRHLGPDWAAADARPRVWAGIDSVDDAELWETQQVLKAAPGRLRPPPPARPGRAPRRGADVDRSGAGTVLDLDALTIGFARRFATYKRGTCCSATSSGSPGSSTRADRPVQLVFAGKAHPRGPGRQGADPGHRPRLAQRRRFRRRIVFVEDYDMSVARHLVAGRRRLAEQPAPPARGQRHLAA